MNSDSIETDETPCPLTISDWIVFLTAESRTVHGYINLVVMVISMFVAILVAVAIYVASYHEYFNSFMKLVYIVIVAAAMYYILKYAMEHAIDILKEEEEDKNSKIIRDIISGDLPDSDKIRERWEKTHDSPENAEELLKICEKQIETRWKMVKFLKLTGHSFTNNFKAIKENIHFDTPDASETEKFIAVCENRRERAKILLSEIGPLIGFGVAAMVGVALLFAHGIVPIPIYISLLVFLFLCVAVLFILLANYRIQVHAWAAFEEGAILQKPPAEE